MSLLTTAPANEALSAIMRSFDSDTPVATPRRSARPLPRTVHRRPSANPKSKIDNRKS